MKIICGVTHFFNPKIGGIQGMDDHSFYELKKNVFPLVRGERTLFISEGSTGGIIKPQSNRYKHLVQMLHPKLLQFFQQEKIDLLCSDARSFTSTEDKFLQFVEESQLVAESVEMINVEPRSLSQLERMIKDGELKWRFKKEATEKVKTIKNQITESYHLGDDEFIKQIDESNYENTVLIVGLSHFINMKTSYENKGYNFINLVDLKTITADFMALAHICYYLNKPTSHL